MVDGLCEKMLGEAAVLANRRIGQAARYERQPPVASVATALGSTINDDPSPEHAEYTPSVEALIDMGRSALDDVLPLMLSDDFETRLRAEVVMREVLRQIVDTPPLGETSPQDEERGLLLWETLGSLDAQDSRAERQEAVDAWNKWLSENSSSE